MKFQEFTDSQWQVIEKILNVQRKRKHSLRTIINAVFLSIIQESNGETWIVNTSLGNCFLSFYTIKIAWSLGKHP
jgi:hypothetical protein